MNVPLVAAIGAALGLLANIPILFIKDEPYRIEILIAATLKGLLVGIIVALSLSAGTSWWRGLGAGAAYGLAFSCVVFLAKGGFKSHKAHQLIVVWGVATGALTGLLAALLG